MSASFRASREKSVIFTRFTRQRKHKATLISLGNKGKLDRFSRNARGNVGNAENGKTQRFLGKVTGIFIKLWEGRESTMETLTSRKETSNLHKG